MKLIKSITQSIVSNYRLVLLIVLLLSIPFGYFTAKIHFYNDIEIYFDKGDKDISYYKKFQKVYGNEQIVVAVFKDKELFTNEKINFVRKMSGELKKLEGVQRVFSLTEAKEAVETSDSIDYVPIIPEGDLNDEQLKKIRDTIVSKESMVNSLISKDGETTAFALELKTMDKDAKEKTLQNIIQLSDSMAGDMIKLHYTGMPFIETELNRLSARDLSLFIPILIALIFLVTILLLKSLTLALLSQLNLIITIVWSVGLFIMFGESFNIVVVTMIAILLAISIADSIHILSQYKGDLYRFNFDNEKAVNNTITHVWLPCFLTSLTTAAGFCSFMSGSIRPVSVMGVFTAVGVMIAFILSVSFLPAMLLLKKSKPPKKVVETSAAVDVELSSERKPGLLSRALLGIGRFSTTYIKSVIVFFMIAIALGITGISKLTFESDSMRYLPEDNSFKKDFTFIEKNLGGSNPFVILLQAKGDADFSQPEALRLLDTVQRDIAGRVKKITSSSSITSYLKECNSVVKGKEFYKIPNDPEEILEYYETAGVEVIDRLLGPGYKEARITFNTLGGSNEEAVAVTNEVDEYLKKELKSSFSYRVTGLAPLYVTLGKNLKSSQIKSFTLAFSIIFIMMLIVCRNVKLALLSMIPNLFPVAITLGYMGWFNIPLTATTIMIASITLGIAVDDSIHFIVSLRRKVGAGHDMKTALLEVYGDIGKPILITSLLLFMGFGVLMLGSTLPTQFFGILTAFSMLIALVGDIFILPALILVIKPEVKPLPDKEGVSFK
ncbi:MAG: MMPL family transporter [bacterium]|nr:MMPL family transporter [bacterium]